MVNTNGREYLRACLAAIERVHPAGLSRELLVLDNASDDGSADMVRAEHPQARLIALDRRTGKAENDSTLLRAAAGRHCLLLNEDSELHDGAVAALVAAMDDDRGAAAAGAQLLTRDGEPTACAWRLPGAGHGAGHGACSPHRSLVVQSRGAETRAVGWAQSSAHAGAPRRRRAGGLPGPRLLRVLGRDRLLQAPARRGLDGAARARRARRAPRPAEQRPAPPPGGGSWSSTATATCTCASTTARSRAWRCGRWAPGSTARWPLAALVVPGHDPRRYLLNARQELTPGRGEGITRSRRRIQPPEKMMHRMAHPDLAHLAAVLAAAGAVLMLAGRGRLMVLGGLVLLGAAEAGLLASRSDTAALDRLTSASGAAAGGASACWSWPPRPPCWCAGRAGCRS